ncbi:hypothetical protein GIB67_002873 [Kingdonia uniflora]|uniref:WD repeat-containing protein 74 n=1 Tax=Kingdonia uniflora TaxID=39325 RepID=A0A7J7M5B6_9MAGN|nr:hypothetical protein GIB67_002873 [Kingdonia uniflora]
MPRSSTVECGGCPPFRALSFDVLGLIKVIEARGGQQGNTPKIVERWGEPDASRCIVAVSINDRQNNPLVAVGRKNGEIELLSATNGDRRAAVIAEGGAIASMHLFKKEQSELSSRSCTLLTCTINGKAMLRSIEITNSSSDSNSTDDPSTTWNVCSAGTILCSSVDGNEKYALFGGKGVELNMWDLEKRDKNWSAKSPPKNNLDIFTPTWFTSAAFLDKDDHRKVVVGTNSHQVRLYDISAQRRPVISVDFRESPIKAVIGDLDGNTIYFGTGSGDLASVDMRTGKILGCFVGKCSGSIRSIVRHPEFPVIASCGLDGYLRVWDLKSRDLLSAVFLKQQLTNVVLDTNFSGEEPTSAAANSSPNDANAVMENQDEEDTLGPVKRKKSSKDNKQSKKHRKSKKKLEEEDDD